MSQLKWAGHVERTDEEMRSERRIEEEDHD